MARNDRMGGRHRLVWLFVFVSVVIWGGLRASAAEAAEPRLVDFNTGSMSGGIYEDGTANVWKFAGDVGAVSLEGGQLKLGPAASSTIGVFDYGFAANPARTYKNFEMSYDVTVAGYTSGGNLGFQFQKTGWSNGWGAHNKIYMDTAAHMAFLNGTTRLTDRHPISGYGGPAITASQPPWTPFRVKVAVQDGSVRAYVNGSSSPIVAYDELASLPGYTPSGLIGLFTFAGITSYYDNVLVNEVADESERPTFPASAGPASITVTLPSTPSGMSGYNVHYRNVTDAVSESVYAYRGGGGLAVELPVASDKVYEVKLLPVYTSDRTQVDTEWTAYQTRHVLVGTPPAQLSLTPGFTFSSRTAEVELKVVGAETIRYTLDGSDPGPGNGLELSGDGAFGTTLTLDKTTTLKAAAYTNGALTASLQQTYSALPGVVAIEEPFAYHGPYFHDELTLTLRSDYADAIVYTTDGSEPAYNAATHTASNGTLLAGDRGTVTLAGASATVKARAIRSDASGAVADKTLTYLTPGVQAAFYVDPVNGNDAAAGTALAPWRTLDAARDAVRAINGAMTGDIVVYLRGGEYALAQTWALDERDSGSRSFQVVYRAYPGESPVISGGERVTGWTLFDVTSNVYRAPLPVGVTDTRQLYVGGERAVRARSEEGLPNATFDATGDTTTMTGMASWRNIDDIEMVYKERWTSSRYSVDSISVSGATASIVMDQPGWSYGLGKGSTAPTVPWYIENAFELLDQPGEWYLDKAEGYFYYKPRAGEDMATADVVVPRLTELLTVRGESVSQPAHDIAFEGLTFNYAGWLRPNTDAGHSDVQANYVREPALPGNTYKQEFIIDAAVVVQSGRSVHFERDVFARLGATGLNLLDGSQDNRIRGSQFYDISGSAIQIGEVDMNDLNNRNPSDPNYLLENISVENNYIHDVAVEYLSGVGVSAAYPDSLRIVHNEFERLPYSAVHIGWGWSVVPLNATRNNVISGNYIHNVMNTLHDGGAIYTVGRSLGDGSVSSITYNDIRHVRNYHGALYFDQGSSDWRANDNVVGNTQKLIVASDSQSNIKADGNVSDSLGIAAPGGIVTNTVYVTDGVWPQKALDIRAAAGVQEPYQDILPSVRPPEEEEEGDLLEDDFEAYVIGGNTTEWNKVQTGGLISVVSEAGNQYLELKSAGSGGTGAIVAYRLFKGAYGQLTFEYRIRASAAAGFRLAPYLLSANSDPVITLGMMNGQFVNNKGASGVVPIQSYTTDRWYDVKIDANTLTHTFDLYIDGVLKLSAEPFRTAASEFDQIRFGNEATVAGDLDVDDVRVYKSE